jgi:nitrate/nitrite transporter NarK
MGLLLDLNDAVGGWFGSSQDKRPRLKALQKFEPFDTSCLSLNTRCFSKRYSNSLAMKNNRRVWATECLLFGLYCCFGLNWLAYAPGSGYFEGALKLDHASSASLISVVSLASAFMPIFGGGLYQRWGGRNAILVASLLMSTSVICPWIGSFWLLLLLRFLFGLGGALVATLMSSIVMKHFEASKFQILSGLNNVSGNVGITAAIYFSPDLAAHFGWQRTLTLFGTSLIVLAIAWALIYTRKLEKSGRASADILHEHQESEPDQVPALGSVYRDPVTWWLVLGFLGPLGSYLALNTWMPQYYVEQFSWTMSDAGQLLAFLNLTGLPAAPLGGWLADRFLSPRQILLICGLGLPLSSLLMLWQPNYAWLGAGLSGFFFLLYVGPFFTIPMLQPQADPERVARQIGVVMSIAYLVTFGAPVLVGYLKDIGFGYSLGLSGMAITSTSLLICALFVFKKPNQGVVS